MRSAFSRFSIEDIVEQILDNSNAARHFVGRGDQVNVEELIRGLEDSLAACAELV